MLKRICTRLSNNTLYQEISFGSIFSSDYENSLGVDEEEVYHYSEMFLEDMYQQGREESYNEEDFVQFITDYCWLFSSLLLSFNYYYYICAIVTNDANAIY